jgi:predicted RNA-binding protein with PIN domain
VKSGHAVGRFARRENGAWEPWENMMANGGPQKIIVDGYNVIYTDDRLRRLACRNLERARKDFLHRLERYLKKKKVQVTVVFDGRGALSDAEVVIPGKLQVVYTAGGQTADDLIISTLKQSGNAQSYLVVSSDRTHIGAVARGLGCQVLGSLRFLERLTPGESGAKAENGEEPDPQLMDTDYWLEEFGKADE